MSKLIETWYEVDGPAVTEKKVNYARALDRARYFADALSRDFTVYECTDNGRTPVAIAKPSAFRKAKQEALNAQIRS